MLAAISAVGSFAMPRRMLFELLVTAAAFSLLLQPAAAGSEACAELVPGPAHSVTSVSDGETVTLDDGTELRLIGALAPRALDTGSAPGTWPPEVAAIAELRALVVGKSVELAFGGERTDRYGRWQAHVFIREGHERQWVQGHLIEQGLARAYLEPGNRACGDLLLSAERAAREGRRGLWSDAAYAIRDAHRPARLARYRSTFQIVEGRIAGVAQVRGVVYLNFGADWRRSFSVSLRRGDRALLGAHAADPKAMVGQQVRVRGWVEPGGTPTMDLSKGGTLEVVGSAPSPSDPLPGGNRTESPRQETKPPGLIETGR
jgi:micrococcal nuclease